MDIIRELLTALWQQDFNALADPSLLWIVYTLLFVILVLENGLLPAAFLPGDSLLILVGVLIAKGAMGFPQTLIILTIAASLGSWIGYLQGRWLSDTRTIKRWLAHLPAHYHQRAHRLFHHYGLFALLGGRFLAFIRTVLPTMAGIAGLRGLRFHVFNWLSGFIWVFILTLIGFGLGNSDIFQQYEQQFTSVLMLVPIVLLVAGLIGSIWVVWRKRRQK